MLQILRKIRDSFCKSEVEGELGSAVYKDQRNIGWNIYEPNITVSEYAKRFRRMHVVFKHRVFDPLLLLLKKVLGKDLKTQVPHDDYNKNLIIFENAFNKSLYIWTKYVSEIYQKPMTPQEMDKQLNSNCQNRLRDLKNIYITMLLNDTVYREFHNILMFEIARGMNEQHDANAYHLLYTSKKINDVAWLYISREVNSGRVPIKELCTSKGVEEDGQNKSI